MIMMMMMKWCENGMIVEAESLRVWYQLGWLQNMDHTEPAQHCLNKKGGGGGGGKCVIVYVCTPYVCMFVPLYFKSMQNLCMYFVLYKTYVMYIQR